ncbi:hypothetical protein [Kutzneria sp. NPDC052558]|uniref:hypothetical protein n=1 Tax=Kutzneria sp. NPDC052558 TaxID=3364121 RepID=UPI0037C83651
MRFRFRLTPLDRVTPWRGDDIAVTATVPMRQWLAALAEFDRELVAAMAERLGDDPALLIEHEQRARWVAKTLP